MLSAWYGPFCLSINLDMIKTFKVLIFSNVSRWSLAHLHILLFWHRLKSSDWSEWNEAISLATKSQFLLAENWRARKNNSKPDDLCLFATGKRQYLCFNLIFFQILKLNLVELVQENFSVFLLFEKSHFKAVKIEKNSKIFRWKFLAPKWNL